MLITSGDLFTMALQFRVYNTTKHYGISGLHATASNTNYSSNNTVLFFLLTKDKSVPTIEYEHDFQVVS